MKKIYLLIIVLILNLTSCEESDFLDKQPYDKITIDNLIVDYSTFEAAVNGVYNIFQQTYYYNSYYIILPDLMSDNVLNNNYFVFSDIDKYETKADDKYAARVWSKIASLIAQASIVIRQAEAFDFGSEQEEANKLIGQLYITRGLAYFDMQRLFAQPYNYTSDASHPGMPIINEDIIGIEIQNPPRSTTKEVYDKIIDDFNKGISIIGDDNTSVYYINKNAAKALLARVYLYMEEWEKANSLADEVINSGNYSLVSNSEYVYSWTQDFSSESIFSIVNLPTDYSRFSSVTYYYSYKRFLATDDLYNSFDDNDVRKNLISNNKILKYTSSTFDDNIPVIRLSELYLIKAEALAELNDDEGAREALNIIHNRANPGAPDYTESGDALKDIILEERRKELMFEGHRLFDLTRKKKNFIKYSTSVANPISITYPDNFTILPIPQSEIDANSNMQQNPGY
ncbi:MAG: RagB/SusD family nutrient uptake outer membrane protein [Chlorobi bacterium]|nr:RagB/SusD family nutrient uptake outer membrane protein [Chlorobiota bacterium]